MNQWQIDLLRRFAALLNEYADCAEKDLGKSMELLKKLELIPG